MSVNDYINAVFRTEVGTKIFWSPEFFDRDYGHKVEILCTASQSV